MKTTIKLLAAILGAYIIVFLSPLLVKYPHTVPLFPGGPQDDTITNYYSGFPIPYMHRSNLSMGMDINNYIFTTDVILTAAGLGWLLCRNRKKTGAQQGGPGYPPQGVGSPDP